MSIFIDSEKNRTLALQLKMGDEKAFREFYDLTLPFIYSVVGNFCGTSEKTKDIVQEVYTDVWKQRSSLDENLSLVGLLKIITQRRIWRDAESGKKIRVEVYPLTGSASYADYSIEEKDNDKLLSQALSSLSRRQKEIFLLISSGLSTAEIAGKLNISKRTTENQLFRARKNIVKYLRKQNIIS